MTKPLFDPVVKGNREAPNPAPLAEWRPIVPAPQDAPAPPAAHPKLGMPAFRWEYRDASEKLLGIVDRYETKDGKEVRPLVFAEHEKWGREWRWRGFPKPRPLYGLDRLAMRPDAPALVCEGEKSADAAGRLLPDFVAVTSPGGSKAAKDADWSVLAGREVVIWRDADAPGEAYMRRVLDMLGKLSPAPAVKAATPPEGVPLGWDAADALAEGWDTARAAALIRAAELAPDDETAARPRKPNTRDWLLGLIEEDAELWHDRERVAYASVTVDDHRENHEIASRGFRGWLAWRAYGATGVSPASEAIEAALRVAGTLALNRGGCHPTWRRLAEEDGRIYLDLGCRRWRAVEISATTGWRVVDAAPCKFLRSRGMAELPEPEAGELIETLREFVNVESDGDFRLVVAWLVAALRPTGPYPILTITGQQGASKSTLARICRLLIDPNASPIRAAPRDDRDLLVSAFNSWLLVYDNLSSVAAWLSDALCRLSTGGGFATRQLQTDRDEMIFSAQRPIALNGIGDLAARPDLADRVLSITLPPLSDDRRRDEREFWAAFEHARPVILGALLDAVAAGLRHLPETVLAKRPRMADFATWAEACAPGLGWKRGEFLRDYEENRSDAVAAAADAAPLLPVIEAVLGRSGLVADGFDGTANDLLAKFHEVCPEAQRKQRWFPGTASQVGSALRRLAPLLRSRGIMFEPYKDTDRKRTRRLVLRCVSEIAFEELRARLKSQPPPDSNPAP